MLYVAYLDEFGHIGPYISCEDPKHKTHPVFGLGGLVLPYDRIRYFSTFFFKTKTDLFGDDIEKTTRHAAEWEKKGSEFFRTNNITKRRHHREAFFRILNQIRKCGGFVIYVGHEKRLSVEEHDAQETYNRALGETIKRLDQECSALNAKLLIILDQQEEKAFRPKIVKKAALEMYGREPRKSLIEPPMQAESHLYNNLQCADWICSLVGKMAFHDLEEKKAAELGWVNLYFRERLKMVERRSSIRKLKDKGPTEVSLRKLCEKINSRL